ncbi:uncharacterized protein LOC109616920 [Esox lucius]|uniref:uncharacterized protein LOC109616920 n=1 Tax=Esox lucius TaxID=8010 RepID=UPI001476CC1C|nr:uncharacterized protein LOC109616920 [Esox lucius]
MEEYKVVQRSDDCIQREGKKDVEEELEYQPKMEANIRTCSSKKSGEQAVDNDAGSTHKPLDRETVIHHLEEKVCTFAISPGNNHEMGYCYPILKSFMRNLTNEQWQALCKALKTPMTSEHFVKLCKTIVTFITQSTLHILLPTLARMLGETGCKGGDTDLPKRARSAKPFAAFQQERLELIREVKYLAKEMHENEFTLNM